MPPKKKSRTASILAIFQKQVDEKNAKRANISSAGDPEIITIEDTQPSFSHVTSGNPVKRKRSSIGIQAKSSNVSTQVLKSNVYENLYRNEDLLVWEADLEALKQFRYPIDQQLRNYEIECAKHCMAMNTCISLPYFMRTEFIIGSVFYNFSSIFPTGVCLYCCSSLEEANFFKSSCISVGFSEAEVTIVPAYNNMKRLKSKLGKVIVSTPQCIAKIVENDQDISMRVRCLSICLSPGEPSTKYQKFASHLTTLGIPFRIITVMTAIPDSSRKTSAITKRQQLITSLVVSNWIEVADLDNNEFRQDVIPMGISISYFKNIDLSTTVNSLVEVISKSIKPILESLPCSLFSTDIMKLLHMDWKSLKKGVDQKALKVLCICEFFCDLLKWTLLYGPRVFVVILQSTLNQRNVNSLMEDLQMFIIENPEVYVISEKCRLEYADNTSTDVLISSHTKYSIIREKLKDFLQGRTDIRGVITCPNMEIAKVVCQIVNDVEDMKLVLLVDNDEQNSGVKGVSSCPLSRSSTVFHQNGNIVVVLPFNLDKSIQTLDGFCSSVSFVIATDRSSICFVENYTGEYHAVLNKELENLREMDGRLVTSTSDLQNRSFSGKEGSVNKYSFKFEPSRLCLDVDKMEFTPFLPGPSTEAVVQNNKTNIRSRTTSNKRKVTIEEEPLTLLSQNSKQVLEDFNQPLPSRNHFNRRSLMIKGEEPLPHIFHFSNSLTPLLSQHRNGALSSLFFNIISDNTIEKRKKSRFKYEEVDVDHKRIDVYDRILMDLALV